MQPVTFLGDSLSVIRDWHESIRTEAGHQLKKVQNGHDPDNWKPMKTVGPGVREIRIRQAASAFRVIYLATLSDRVLVLHALQKKTQRTPKKDIDLATRRLRAWKEYHDGNTNV